MLEDDNFSGARVPGSTMNAQARHMDLDMMDQSDNASDYSHTRVERIGTTRNRNIKGTASQRSGSTESMGEFSMADIDDDIAGSDDSDTIVEKETKQGGKAQQKSKFDFTAIPEEK